MTTTINTTRPAPSWADDDPHVWEDLGPRTHPEDQCVGYDQQVAHWTSSPSAPTIPYAEYRVILHAIRHDQGEDDPDTVSISDGTTLQHVLTAVDARRLGRALLDAADLLEKAGR